MSRLYSMSCFSCTVILPPSGERPHIIIYLHTRGARTPNTEAPRPSRWAGGRSHTSPHVRKLLHKLMHVIIPTIHHPRSTTLRAERRTAEQHLCHERGLVPATCGLVRDPHHLLPCELAQLGDLHSVETAALVEVLARKGILSPSMRLRSPARASCSTHANAMARPIEPPVSVASQQ